MSINILQMYMYMYMHMNIQDITIPACWDFGV